MKPGSNSFNTLSTLAIDGQEYHYFSLEKIAEQGFPETRNLPCSLKILLENILRFEQGSDDAAGDIKAFDRWVENRSSDREIAFRPARVLMQDFTGVPAVVDLAAMRDAAADDPQRINPQIPVDLVIDHSVMVDEFATPGAFAANVALEVKRNDERYRFLKWGAQAFANFRVVPPGTGICHQVNLEYLARTVWQHQYEGKTYVFPDTLVGTDSHTTMINGLGVLGWGVGGIEAEAGMLGQPISLLIPEVVGFRFTGQLREGITATDLVLTVTQMLRQYGVVGKFVEFCGDGLAQLPLADRATLANMSPEYGATCGFFPVDDETIRYLRLTGRDEQALKLVEAYCRAQGMWYQADTPDPVFSNSLTLDLSTVEASLAGPKRPQDRVALSAVKAATEVIINGSNDTSGNAAGELLDAGLPAGAEVRGKDQVLPEAGASAGLPTRAPVRASDHELLDGDVVIAAVTSCTNTSNPKVMMAAGLLARNARAAG
ncbi:MAG: aconitase family protein, partial [Gammaproteobacteria bacterium]|nr:aconitase family protein [Gammaproteobacteria bacterium]